MIQLTTVYNDKNPIAYREDNKSTNRVHRKPTNTDQYTDYTSNHSYQSKQEVVSNQRPKPGLRDQPQ